MANMKEALDTLRQGVAYVAQNKDDAPCRVLIARLLDTAPISEDTRTQINKLLQ